MSFKQILMLCVAVVIIASSLTLAQENTEKTKLLNNPKLPHDAKDEHGKIITLLTYYGTVRTVQFSIFVTGMGVALAFLFGREKSRTQTTIVFGSIGLAIASICFWAMEFSHTYQVHHLLQRAAELESELGYKVYSSMAGMPEHKIAPLAWGINALYFFSTVGWFFSLIYAIKQYYKERRRKQRQRTSLWTSSVQKKPLPRHKIDNQ